MSAVHQARATPVPHLKLVRVPQPIDVCAISEIPLGQGRAFIIGGHTIALFRQRDGSVYAIDNACPHRGGPLAEGIAGGGFVICPLHAMKIDLRSGRCATETGAVRTYPVDLVDERVWLTIEAES